jgi:hypothetical protein
MWPGDTADVTTLIPVIDRLRDRFSIGRVCVVADRGMISTETIAAPRLFRPSHLPLLWPKRIKALGEIRSQFSHIIDIVPTILEAAGIQAPLVLNRTPQKPLEGVSWSAPSIMQRLRSATRLSISR